jgi:RNA polymerase sigma-70 factor (ECF subfamily)
MSADPLKLLLERIEGGDLEAAGDVFVAFEGYLRKVVRRHLPREFQAKFDSIDIVQSVWVHLLPGIRKTGRHFNNVEHLRAFLVLVTRHRLNDRLRRHHATLEHERQVAGHLERAPSIRQPGASEVAQAEELWNRLLALCPPEHHQVLQLKRQGLLLTEIAARSGLHEGSVRRILRKLAHQMAVSRSSSAKDLPGNG